MDERVVKTLPEWEGSKATNYRGDTRARSKYPRKIRTVSLTSLLPAERRDKGLMAARVSSSPESRAPLTGLLCFLCFAIDPYDLAVRVAHQCRR